MALLDYVRQIRSVGYVYILYHGQVDKDGNKAYKIGKACCIMKRLLHYLHCQLYNPDCFEVIHAWKLDISKYGDLETELHKRFKSSRISNKKKKSEWFWISEKDMDECIADITARDDIVSVPTYECFGNINTDFVKNHYDCTFIVKENTNCVEPYYSERLDNIRLIQEKNPKATLRDIIDANLKHQRTKKSEKKQNYNNQDLAYDIKQGYIVIQ